MKEYYVITNRDGMISLKEKSTSKRDPPSPELQEKKKFLKKAISEHPKFESFLKANKVYGRFISNYMNQRGYRNIEEFKRKCFYSLQSSEPINTSLCWAKTREDHQFWMDLNDKYWESINQ